MNNNSLTIGLDFRYSLSPDRVRGGAPPKIIKSEGIYTKTIDKINKLLSIPTKEEILKIISAKKNISFKEIEKIVVLSHSTMWTFIQELENLELVVKEKKKEEGERKEFKLSLNSNITVEQLTLYEYDGIIGNLNLKELIKDIPKDSKNINLEIVNKKNKDKIIESYNLYLDNKLKSST